MSDARAVNGLRYLITGMNGTVAPIVAQALRARGDICTAWDRSAVSPEDPVACTRLLRQVQPDWILHFGMGDPAWAGWLAGEGAKRGIGVLATSSVSVFRFSTRGPHTLDARPDADDSYGLYKRACEERVGEASAQALIVRLGWQIGDRPGSNTMTDFFARAASSGSVVQASDHWVPACSWPQGRSSP